MEQYGLKLRTEEQAVDSKIDRIGAKDDDYLDLHQKLKTRDADKVRIYDSELDTFLVFAGLFSAVVTAFIIDSYKPDPKTDSLDAGSKAGTTGTQPVYGLLLTIVIALWIASLIITLAAALACISLKQWFHAYTKWSDPTTFQECLMLRGFYLLGWKTWHLEDMFAAIGPLLQLALLLFLVGLACYLWTLLLPVAVVVTALVIVVGAVPFWTAWSAWRRNDCPYKFPGPIHWSDRDLPSAKQVYLTNMPAVGMAAVVLDIPPSIIDEALKELAGPADSRDHVCATAVESRVRQLPLPSKQLLMGVLSSKTLLETAAGHGARMDLLRLWRLIISAMETPPSSISFLLYHLADTLPSSTGLDQAKLLVDMLDHCAALSRDSSLSPTELSNHALKLEEWSRGVPVGKVNGAMELALRSLYYAMSYIPVPTEAPKSGLSPITPYLTLLDAFEATLSRAGGSAHHAHGHKLHSDLQTRHRSFFCTRGREFYRTEGITAFPLSGLFSQDKLYIGTDESAAWVLDLQADSCRTLTPVRLPSNIEFRRAMFARDGSWIIWGSREGDVHAVDSTGSPPQRLFDRSLVLGRKAHPMAVSWDNKYVIFGSEDTWADTVEIKKADTDTVMTLEGHTRHLRCAAFAREPPYRVATSSFDNTVKIWDIRDGSLVQNFDEVTHSVNAVEWSPDGTLIAISTQNHILVFEWERQELRATLVGHTDLVTSVSFSPNGKLVASGSNDHTVRVWSVEKAVCITTLAASDDEVNWVGFSPSGAHLAAAADKSVWVWDVNPMCIYPPDGNIVITLSLGHVDGCIVQSRVTEHGLASRPLTAQYTARSA